MPEDIIVLTWKANDGLEPTGRLVLRDGYHRAEMRSCMVARALVWSRDLRAKAAAEEYARKEEQTVRVRIMPDTPDVLDLARKLELAS